MLDDWRTLGLNRWLAQQEREAILQALREAQNVLQAARLLRINRTTLGEKMARHGIRKKSYLSSNKYFHEYDGDRIIGIAEGAYSESSPSFFCE